MDKLKETNARLESHQNTVETEAIRQSEQAIRTSIAPQIESIAYQSVTQNAIAITEKIVRESINKGVSKALSENESAN